MKKSMKIAQRMVNLWNLNYPIGTEVEVTKDLGEKVHTKTTSDALVSSAGIAVIFLEGISGYYLLDRVKASVQ